MPTLTLAEIATLLQCPSPSDPQRPVTGIRSLADAQERDLSFLGSDKYLSDFEKTRAAAVIVHKRVKLPPEHHQRVLLVDDAELAIAKLLEHFTPPVPRPTVGAAHTAFVAPSASVGEGARIGHNVFIGDDCRIGKN